MPMKWFSSKPLSKEIVFRYKGRYKLTASVSIGSIRYNLKVNLFDFKPKKAFMFSATLK